MAIPAARDPGPLVTLVRNRTVANVDNYRVRRAQMHPVLGRVAVELQEHIGVVDDLGDRFGVLGAIVDLEGLDRDLSLSDVLGVVDVLDCRRRRGVRGFRQRGRNIGLPVEPAALPTGIRKHLPDRFPEPQRVFSGNSTS